VHERLNRRGLCTTGSIRSDRSCAIRAYTALRRWHELRFDRSSVNELTRTRLALVVGVVAAMWIPRPANAHPDVEEGRRLALEADVDGARAALDRAERSSTLSVPELVRLLEARALVAMADGLEDRVEAALRDLASIAPEHHLDRDVPPRLHAALDRVRRAIEPLTVELVPDDGPPRRVHARTMGHADVVRRLELDVRGGPNAGVHDGREPIVVAGASRVRARALGPGDAAVAISDEIELEAEERVVAADLAPATAAATVAPTARNPSVEGPPLDADDGLPVWPFVVGGAVAAVAAAVVIALVLPGSDTRVSTPSHPFQ
jgi:hypothetical protein